MVIQQTDIKSIDGLIKNDLDAGKTYSKIRREMAAHITDPEERRRYRAQLDKLADKYITDKHLFKNEIASDELKLMINGEEPTY
jgi:hypothetical protein